MPNLMEFVVGFDYCAPITLYSPWHGIIARLLYQSKQPGA